ncbi:MAG: RNA-splicing ligase RtcB [Thermotogae bacterium]|nr:MAG: RNA-splicing ligase RtcB [Thermotogota bacterium]
MKIRKLGKYKWMIEKEGNMKVPAVIFTDEESIESEELQNAAQQIANVATLSGIVRYAVAMPDIHWGYGFPIGGVAAFDTDEGIISPGGVGFDINCGVRLLTVDIPADEILPKLELLADAIFRSVPVGVGSRRHERYPKKVLEQVCLKGAQWAVEEGFGQEEDLQHIEDGGRLKEVDPDAVSDRAYERGSDELGTLGSGNHFMEIQRVERVYDREAAVFLGIVENTVTVMIHSGSRGFGHQIATDYITLMRNQLKGHNADLPDRQLINAPFRHPVGQRYYKAMCCAANYAFANRQMITYYVRQAFASVFPGAKLKVVYDVAHNVAKVEEHEVDGERLKLVVHRKGATRAFGPGNSTLSGIFRNLGQPVLIPGDMGTASYVLLGTKEAEKEAFGTTAHGAGRRLGRKEAKRRLSLSQVMKEMRERKIVVRSASKGTLIEEAPEAYKDVDRVVEITEAAGLSKRVVRLVPLAVIKG